RVSAGGLKSRYQFALAAPVSTRTSQVTTALPLPVAYVFDDTRRSLLWAGSKSTATRCATPTPASSHTLCPLCGSSNGAGTMPWPSRAVGAAGAEIGSGGQLDPPTVPAVADAVSACRTDETTA